MKRFFHLTALALIAAAILFLMTGCNQEEQTSSETEISGKMRAIVTEVADDYVIVEPVEGAQELRFGSVFRLAGPLTAQVKDIIDVQYVGVKPDTNPVEFEAVLSTQIIQLVPTETLDKTVIGIPAGDIDFFGEVKEIGEDYLMVQPFDSNRLDETVQYRVSTERMAPLAEGETLAVGNMVRVWFDGRLDEESKNPPELHAVSMVLAIVGKSPAAIQDTTEETLSDADGASPEA